MRMQARIDLVDCEGIAVVERVEDWSGQSNKRLRSVRFSLKWQRDFDATVSSMRELDIATRALQCLADGLIAKRCRSLAWIAQCPHQPDESLALCVGELTRLYNRILDPEISEPQQIDRAFGAPGTCIFVYLLQTVDETARAALWAGHEEVLCKPSIDNRQLRMGGACSRRQEERVLASRLNHDAVRTCQVPTEIPRVCP